jgi:hypothetical protein
MTTIKQDQPPTWEEKRTIPHTTWGRRDGWLESKEGEDGESMWMGGGKGINYDIYRGN